MGKHKNLQQEDAFIKFMEQHSDIARGFTKSEKGLVENLWKDLTKELNSMGPPLHDMSGWKKVWCDWKACIKKKIATNKMEAKATGGGPYNQLYISKKEEAVGQLCVLFAIVEGIQGSNSFGTNNTSNLLLSSDEEVFLTEKNSKAGKTKSTEVDSEAPSTSKRASLKSRDDNLKDHLKQYIGSDLQNRTKISESLQNLTDISQLNTEKLDIIGSNIRRPQDTTMKWKRPQ